MKDVIARIMQQVAQMSDEQFARKIYAYREDEVALTLRHLEEMAHYEKFEFFINEFFSMKGSGISIQIEVDLFESYSLALQRAANDERFCLAA